MDVRVTVLTLSCLVCLVSKIADAQRSGVPDTTSATMRNYQLRGVVIDSARTPIPGAEVSLVETGQVRQRTVTPADGRFTLGSIPAGPHSLRVRRLGYEPRILEVRAATDWKPTLLEVVLTMAPQELEEILVNSELQGRLREFHERREQRAAFGRFLDQKDIRRLGPSNSSDLFRNVPGIIIRAASMGGNSIRIRDCQPMVWVDGQRVPGAELDEVIQPGEIAAIEFYPSSAGIPAQYLERGNRLCGLILVWTKTQ